MDKEFVTYNNTLEFNGRKLAFKKQMLFDITNVPQLINRTEQGWWVARKLLTVTKAKELTIINQCVSIDISHLQWHEQCHIQECFNL